LRHLIRRAVAAPIFAAAVILVGVAGVASAASPTHGDTVSVNHGDHAPVPGHPGNHTPAPGHHG